LILLASPLSARLVMSMCTAALHRLSTPHMSRVLTEIKKPLPPSSRRWTYKSKASRYCSSASYPHPLGGVSDAGCSCARCFGQHFQKPQPLKRRQPQSRGPHLQVFARQKFLPLQDVKRSLDHRRRPLRSPRRRTPLHPQRRPQETSYKPVVTTKTKTHRQEDEKTRQTKNT
jgi:hypothetical protein